MSDTCCLRDGWPSAAKVHTCAWCDEPIAKAERHYHFVGRYLGDWQDWRMHEECHAAWNAEPAWKGGEFLPGSNERPAREERPTPREVALAREQAGQLTLRGAL